MVETVGVRFREAGKIYDFSRGDLVLEVNDMVVVETARGLELGQVIVATGQVTEEDLENPLKPVIRKATDEDIAMARSFEEKEKEALEECARLVEKLGLEMKLLAAEYNLDGSRLTLHFSAEERVDFRELVRELAKKLRVRVEMRQTGPRDEAKMMGGCGRCGRPLCCATFLSNFTPVSMRMAKDQGLPLNPMKISGVCGRLMCCLVYENEYYQEMKGKLPRIGLRVGTPSGDGRVVETNPLKVSAMVELDSSKAIVEFPLADIAPEGEGRREPEPVIVEEPLPIFIRATETPATPSQNERNQNAGNKGGNRNQNQGNRNSGNRRSGNRNRRNNPGKNNPQGRNTNEPSKGKDPSDNNA